MRINSMRQSIRCAVVICSVVSLIILMFIYMSHQPIHMTGIINKEDKSATIFIEWDMEKQIACNYSTSVDFVKKPLPLTSTQSKRSGYDAVSMTFQDRESIAINVNCQLNTGEEKSYRIYADKIPMIELIGKGIDRLF